MNIRFSVVAKEPLPVVLDVAPIVNAKEIADARETEGAYAQVVPVYGPPELKEFRFPRFRRRDWKAWRAAIDAERLEQATADMDPVEKARTLLLYPLAPLTHGEMRARINTVEGTGFVFATCARAAGVPEHAIARAVDDGDADEVDMETLALMLAGFADPAQVAAAIHEQMKREKKARGEGGDDKGNKGDGEDDDAGEGDPGFSGGTGDLDAFQQGEGDDGAAPEADKSHPFTPSGGGLRT